MRDMRHSAVQLYEHLKIIRAIYSTIDAFFKPPQKVTLTEKRGQRPPETERVKAGYK